PTIRLLLHIRYPLSFFTAPATTEIYTLSLHDALPISHAGATLAARSRYRSGFHDRGRGHVPKGRSQCALRPACEPRAQRRRPDRSEEHTSELQSRFDLVCRLLLEKKNQ